MGSVIPVLLFIVDTSCEDIYFLNLNDYIDKVLIPNDSKYFEKNHKTIYIPIANKITRDINTHLPLLFYSKRPKYYSFFNKIGFQTSELNYIEEDNLVEQLKYFSNILLSIDVWDYPGLWKIIDTYKSCLDNFINDRELGLFGDIGELDDKEKIWETNKSFGKLYTKKESHYYMQLRVFWQQMKELSNIYEDTCREFFQPTYMGEFCKEE